MRLWLHRFVLPAVLTHAPTQEPSWIPIGNALANAMAGTATPSPVIPGTVVSGQWPLTQNHMAGWFHFLPLLSSLLLPPSRSFSLLATNATLSALPHAQLMATDIFSDRYKTNWGQGPSVSGHADPQH